MLNVAKPCCAVSSLTSISPRARLCCVMLVLDSFTVSSIVHSRREVRPRRYRVTRLVRLHWKHQRVQFKGCERGGFRETVTDKGGHLTKGMNEWRIRRVAAHQSEGLQ